MAYIGQQPVVGRYILLDQISGGFNGTASGFTMSTAGGVQGVIPGLAQNVLLSLGGVIQQPGVDYTISGSGLTFTTPPVSGTTFFATVLGDAQSVGTPSDGTVTPASIAAGYDFAFPNLTVTGITTIASGTAAAPSLTVTGDTDTGLYSPGANQLAISTNGTGRLFVDASGNVGVGITPSGPFDVYGGTWKRLLVTYPDTYTTKLALSTGGYLQSSVGDDAVRLYNTANGPTIFATNNTERLRITSDGKLGLGTSAPASKLDIQDTSGTTNAPVIIQNISALSSGTVANGFGPAIRFQGEDAGGANRDMAYVSSVYTNASTVDTALTFYTRDNLGALTEKVRIDEQGRVGIGTTAPSHRLHVLDNTNNVFLQVEATGTAKYAQINLRGTSTANYISSDDDLAFYANAGERARIDSSGRLLVGTSSARSNFYNGSTDSPAFQIEGTGSNDSHASIVRNQGGEGSTLILGCSGGTSLGSNTLVSNGDRIGHINFQATDGAEFVQAANIKAEVDGTPGANDMPGRLVFSTTADGASSPTERMRIGQAGYAKFSNTGAYFGVSSSYHERNNNAADWIAIDRNSNGTPFGVLFEFDSDPNGTGNQFWRCRGAANTRAELRSNGGIANFSANNVNLSDRNVKKDISPAADTWHCLKEWEIVNFRYKDQPDDADLNLGVIAQQVAESCPEVITVFQEATEDQPEKLGVKDQQMMWMAIKALQEAQLRIETLEAEVAALKGA